MKSGTKNPIAKALRSPHLRQQRIPSKKGYIRKPRHPRDDGASSVFSL